jgi:hypothetical protein
MATTAMRATKFIVREGTRNGQATALRGRPAMHWKRVAMQTAVMFWKTWRNGRSGRSYRKRQRNQASMDSLSF